MKEINKLKLLKNKLKYMAALTTLGFGIFTTNINVDAKDNNYAVEKQEESNTTTNENFNPTTINEYITYYSNVYGIKEEFIYDRLDYMFNENLDNEEFMDMSTELKVLTVTRSIKKDSNISNEKYTGKTYEVTLEPEELIEKYSDIIGTNKYTCLSIAYTECVYPISSDWNYNTNGNLAGIGGSMNLGNKEEGVIETLFIFKDSYGINEDTDSSIYSSISKTYCPPNWQNWQSRAASFYNELKENGYYSRATEEVQNKHKQKTIVMKKED